LAHVAIRNKVIRTVQVKLVDFFLRYELIDLDCALALNGDGLKLFGLDLFSETLFSITTKGWAALHEAEGND